MDGLKEVLEHLGFATPFIYAVAAYGFFAWLDSNASDEAKTALASTMKRNDYTQKQVASALVEVFDRIYTTPLLRLSALLRSALFTFIITGLFLFEANRHGELVFITLLRGLLTPKIMPHLLFFFISNVVSDYVSLFVIRPWLRIYGARPVYALITGMLLAGIVISLGVVLRVIVTDLIVFAWSGIHLWPYKIYWSLLFSSRFAVPAVVVFTWLPLFAIGILGIRALRVLAWAVEMTQWALREGDKHPLKAIGLVAGFVILAVAAAWQTI